MIFYLKTKARHRGYSERLELLPLRPQAIEVDLGTGRENNQAEAIDSDATRSSGTVALAIRVCFSTRDIETSQRRQPAEKRGAAEKTEGPLWKRACFGGEAIQTQWLQSSPQPPNADAGRHSIQIIRFVTARKLSREKVEVIPLVQSLEFSLTFGRTSLRLLNQPSKLRGDVSCHALASNLPEIVCPMLSR